MDVNVHPTKAIVKFLQEDEIIDRIAQVSYLNYYSFIIYYLLLFRKC